MYGIFQPEDNSVRYGIAKNEHRHKRKYKNKSEAQEVANAIENSVALAFTGLNIYQCRFCGYWHVGHGIDTPKYEYPSNTKFYVAGRTKSTNNRALYAKPKRMVQKGYVRPTKQDYAKYEAYELDQLYDSSC